MIKISANSSTVANVGSADTQEAVHSLHNGHQEKGKDNSDPKPNLTFNPNLKPNVNS